eukprot:31148-Pelagococcus_subviridis.AAC.10
MRRRFDAILRARSASYAHISSVASAGTRSRVLGGMATSSVFSRSTSFATARARRGISRDARC